MITTAVIKLQEVKSVGVTKETGVKYMNILGFDFHAEYEEDALVKVSVFGDKMVEYLEKNLTGPRRALVTGVIELNRYYEEVPVEKVVRANGQTFKVKFSVKQEKSNFNLIAKDIKFIDSKENSVVDCVEGDNGEIIEACVLEDGVVNENEIVHASTNFDADTSEETLKITKANDIAATSQKKKDSIEGTRTTKSRFSAYVKTRR